MAIAQAAAYIHEKHCSLSEYPKHYQMYQVDLLTHALLPDEPINRTAATTFTLAMAQVERQCPAANTILSLCAYFAADDISLDLLIAGSKLTRAEVSATIEMLARYSLVTYNPEKQTINIHRLVQNVVRLNHERRQELNWKKQVLGLLTEQCKYDGKNVPDIARVSTIIPHAVQFASLIKDTDAEGILLVELLDRIGGHQLYGTKNYVIASKHYKRALVILEQQPIKDDLNIAATLSNLGGVYDCLGDYQRAKDLSERALIIKEKHLGTEHTEVMNILVTLIPIYLHLGDFQHAKELMKRASAMLERQPNGPEVTAVSLNNFANLYVELGEYKQAKDLLERVLTIDERQYGLEHPQTASVLINLGNVYNELGDNIHSKEFLERALLIQERQYGREHIELSATLDNLGIAYKGLGDCQHAKELYERSLLINEHHYGHEHPQVAETLINLGNIYIVLEDNIHAKESMERALEIFKSHYAHEHPKIAMCLTGLSSVYSGLGNYPRAKELLERALAIFEHHYGHEHIGVAPTLTNLGNVCSQLGDDKHAKEFLERALAIKEHHYGAEHQETAVTQYNLAIICLHLQEMTQAVNLAKHVYAVRQRCFGEEHQDTKNAKKFLDECLMFDACQRAINGEPVSNSLEESGIVIGAPITLPLTPQGEISLLTASSNFYLQSGDYQSAKGRLERLLSTQESLYGHEHPEVATTLVNLGGACLALEDTQKAKGFLERALVIKEHHYGHDNPQVVTALLNLSSVHGVLGDIKKKREFLERALAIQERHYGHDHLAVAKTLVALSDTYDDLSDAKKQKELLERVLVIKEHRYESGHPEIASTQCSLAITCLKLNEILSARHLVEQAYPVLKQCIGEENKNTQLAKEMLFLCRRISRQQTATSMILDTKQLYQHICLIHTELIEKMRVLQDRRNAIPSKKPTTFMSQVIKVQAVTIVIQCLKEFYEEKQGKKNRSMTEVRDRSITTLLEDLKFYVAEGAGSITDVIQITVQMRDSIKTGFFDFRPKEKSSLLYVKLTEALQQISNLPIEQQLSPVLAMSTPHCTVVSTTTTVTMTTTPVTTLPTSKSSTVTLPSPSSSFESVLIPQTTQVSFSPNTKTTATTTTAPALSTSRNVTFPSPGTSVSNTPITVLSITSMRPNGNAPVVTNRVDASTPITVSVITSTTMTSFWHARCSNRTEHASSSSGQTTEFIGELRRTREQAERDLKQHELEQHAGQHTKDGRVTPALSPTN